MTHVRILGTQHCVKDLHEALKKIRKYHYVLCRRDYDEIIVSIFEQQIQSEYYGGNRSASIEDVALDHFSASTKSNPAVSDKEVSSQAVSHSFWSDDSKQYSTTTGAHSKNLLRLLQQ